MVNMQGGVPSLIACLLLSSWLMPLQAQQIRPETSIKWRQSAYQVMSWCTSRIRSNVEGQFSRDEVIRAASLLNALATAGMGSLYPPGSESGSGWHETTARPEIFRNPALAGERAGALVREVGILLNTAQTAEVAAIKLQYGKVVQVCRACHDDFKIRE